MKIYFAGSIRGGRDDQAIYSELIEYLAELGHTVLCEHVGLADLSDQGQKQPSEFIHDRDLGWIDEADCIVAEVSNPSLGVGYEIAYAGYERKIPVLALFRADNTKRLSAMIDGSPHTQVYVYETTKDAKATIDTFLKSL